MRTFLTVFILVTISIIGLNAQSMTKISGYVYSEYGHPLENVNVQITGTAYGAATDIRGYFEINNIFSGEYTLTISHIGYEDQIKQDLVVTKDIPVRLTIHLKPMIGTVEEIVVHADRDTVIESDYIINLSSEQINNSAARTLGELLVQIPGIDLIEDGAGGGSKKISIRGSNPNQVLVLMDGIPLNDPMTGEADLNLVPLSIIEDVTIHKGGNAAKSGSGSMGGQIEIKTRQPIKNEIIAGANYGSFQVKGGRVSLSGSLGGFSLLLNYDYQTEDGNFPYTYQELDGTTITENRQNAGFTSEQLFIKTGFQHESHTLRIQANLFKSTRGLPGLVFFWTPFAHADLKRNLMAAAYSYILPDLRFDLQLSAYQNTSEYKNLWPEEPPLIYKRVPPYNTQYQLKTYQGDFTTTWNWSDQNETIIRLLYRNDEFKDENLLSPVPSNIQEANNLQSAIGIENNWQFLPSHWVNQSSLKLALRYDKIHFQNQQSDRQDTFFSPKIGFFIGNSSTWLWSIQANLGRSFRAPTFADLYYQDFRVRGKATLLPEKSVNFDAGFRLGLPWLGKPELALSYFRQKIEDLIVWELGSFATWQPTNLDAFIEGMEYSLSWPIFREYVIINLNHIQLNARDQSFRHTTHNKYLIYRPEHTTRIGARFQYGDLSIQYQRRIVSERFVTAANTVSLPGYQVDDLTIRFAFSSGPLTWNIRGMLLNMFGERYEIVRDAPLPGRHWRAGLEVVY